MVSRFYEDHDDRDLIPALSEINENYTELDEDEMNRQVEEHLRNMQYEPTENGDN